MVDSLAIFGPFAVSAMLICHAPAHRGHWFVLGFAGFSAWSASLLWATRVISGSGTSRPVRRPAWTPMCDGHSVVARSGQASSARMSSATTEPVTVSSVRQTGVYIPIRHPYLRPSRKINCVHKQARVARRPDILNQRHETVEHPFGSIKQWMDQGTFLVRGLKKVRAGPRRPTAMPATSSVGPWVGPSAARTLRGPRLLFR